MKSNYFRIPAKRSRSTSLDCINIENQLGYTYGSGSLEGQAAIAALAAGAAPGRSSKAVRVAGINRSLHGLPQSVADTAQYDVEVRTREGLLTQSGGMAAMAARATAPRRPFRFEVR